MQVGCSFNSGAATFDPAYIAHAGFVLDAFDQALHDRRPVHRGALVHHSDRGSQYVSIRYSERLAEAGIEPSVGSVGDSYDNARTLSSLEVGGEPEGDWPRLDQWPARRWRRQPSILDRNLIRIALKDAACSRFTACPAFGIRYGFPPHKEE